MEPVEFLKSMGISLTPLNEVTAGDVRSHRVTWLIITAGTHIVLVLLICSFVSVSRHVRRIDLTESRMTQHFKNRLDEGCKGTSAQ